MLFQILPEEYTEPCYVQVRKFPNRRTENHSLGFLRNVLHPVLTTSTRDDKSAEVTSFGSRKRTGDGLFPLGRCKMPRLDNSSRRQKDSKSASFDFSEFSPEEIHVKVTDKAVVVSGSHEDPYNSFSVSRTLPLPEGADGKGVKCRWVNGIVTVEVPCVREQRDIAVERNSTTPETPKRESPCKRKGIQCGNRRPGECLSVRKQKLSGVMDQEFCDLSGLFSSIFGVPVIAVSNDSKHKSGTQRNTDKRDSKRETGETESKTDLSEKDATDNARAAEKVVDTVAKKDSQGEKFVEEDVTQQTTECSADVSQDMSEESLYICPQKENDPEASGADDIEPVSKDDASTAAVASEEATETSQENDTSSQADDKISTPDAETDTEFKEELDLTGYKPEDIRVLFKDGDVIVEAVRDVVGDDVIEIEKLSRRLRVPENVDDSQLKCRLSDTGMLKIFAPFVGAPEKTVKYIPVEYVD